MKNTLLTKGYRYFVRLSGSGVPVLGSLVARRVAPRRSNGTWTEITSCLTGCCAVTLTVVTPSLPISKTTAGETVYNLKSLAGVISSNGDTITNNVITQTINGVTVALTSNGILTLTAPSPTNTTFPLTVVFTDMHENQVILTVNASIVIA